MSVSKSDVIDPGEAGNAPFGGKEWAEAWFPTIRNEFEASGCVFPKAVLRVSLHPGTLSQLPVPKNLLLLPDNLDMAYFNTHEGKSAFARKIRHMSQILAATDVLFCSEAWSARTKNKAELEGVDLSKVPGSKSCIFVTHNETRYATSKIYSADITEENGIRKLGEFSSAAAAGAGGRFTTLTIPSN